VIALPDVNVLIALTWSHHVHYEPAWAWFDAQRDEGWATCPVTEAGFVRVSCNRAAVGRAVTPLGAIGVLGELTRLGGHTFWPLDRPIAELPEAVGARLQGYRQITDAVLLAAAIQRGGQLATFDQGLEGLVPERHRVSLRVLPV
jgi:hypothetical protein